jgi:hypothetical protein
MSNGVNRITIQLRRPSGKDPGKIAEGWYCVNADNVVVLCDEAGRPAGTEKHELGPDGDARLVASMLLRKREKASRSSGDFNRPLRYPKIGF